MGLFGKNKQQQAEIDLLKDEVRAMRDRMERADTDKARLEQQVGRLDAENRQLRDQVDVVTDLRDELDRITTAVHEPPAEPPPVPGPDPELLSKVDDLESRIQQLAEKLPTLDHRIDNVAVELANQITELGHEIDQLTERPAVLSGFPELDEAFRSEVDAKITERVDRRLDDITDGQERLASEQARYEIQFRQDLADLADRLRRTRS